MFHQFTVYFRSQGKKYKKTISARSYDQAVELVQNEYFKLDKVIKKEEPEKAPKNLFQGTNDFERIFGNIFKTGKF